MSRGFSNYFPRPSYQEKAVNSYFAEHDPGYPYYTFNGVDFHDPASNIGANGGLYNRAGRGFPDVSSNGAHVDVVFYGEVGWQAGTSCAAPTLASIFTLINEKRTQAGKGPIGFVNPVLYEHPEVRPVEAGPFIRFVDIVLCSIQGTQWMFVDILNGANGAIGFQRHPERNQSRLLHSWLRSSKRVGSIYRLGNSQLPQAARHIHGLAVGL
jgi:hypothetical protein